MKIKWYTTKDTYVILNIRGEPMTYYKKEPSHDLVGQLTLSGTEITVGWTHERAGEAIFFQTDEHAEPVYITDQEAELLIAALRVAQCEIRKLGPRVE